MQGEPWSDLSAGFQLKAAHNATESIPPLICSQHFRSKIRDSVNISLLEIFGAASPKVIFPSLVNVPCRLVSCFGCAAEAKDVDLHLRTRQMSSPCSWLTTSSSELPMWGSLSSSVPPLPRIFSTSRRSHSLSPRYSVSCAFVIIGVLIIATGGNSALSGEFATCCYRDEGSELLETSSIQPGYDTFSR